MHVSVMRDFLVSDEPTDEQADSRSWIMNSMQMDMVATYNETLLASNDPRKDLPAGFYTMKSLVRL